MNKQAFLDELIEIMQLDDHVDENATLSEIEEWDSIAVLGVISFFDMEFGKEISADDLKELITVQDLIAFAGSSIEG